MDTTEADVLAFMTFSRGHRAKTHSNNTLGWLNGETKWRTDIIGIFPNEAAVTRLVGAILLEQNDEWAIQRRYMSLGTLAPLRNRWRSYTVRWDVILNVEHRQPAVRNLERHLP